MTNLQTSSNANSQTGSARKPPIFINQPAQEPNLLQNNSQQTCFENGYKTDSDHDLTSTNEPSLSSSSYSKETNPSKNLQWKGESVACQSSKSSQPSRSQSANSRRSRPGSYPQTNSRTEPARSSTRSVTPGLRDSHRATPQLLNHHPHHHHHHHNNYTRRATSLLSSTPTPSPDERNSANGNTIFDSTNRAISCDVLFPRRSQSSQSKYHEDCFPKEDQALIIGSPYRIQSARLRRTKTRKRPIIRHRESLFTHRETVINLVYSANLEAEQDELSRARAETEREARALRSGALASGSFSQGFFNQTGRWATAASSNRQRGGPPSVPGRLYQHQHQHQHRQQMASGVGAAWEYPTQQEDDCSMGRFTQSRQSMSPHSESDASTPPPGFHTFRPTSERSLLSSSRQTDSPNSDSGVGPHHRGSSGFLYQVVGFDNLADNVPPFVRQNVKKNGRLQTESFILKLNYLRRRRALGETSSTINNNAKAKATAAAAAAATSNTGTSSGPSGILTPGQGDFTTVS